MKGATPEGVYEEPPNLDNAIDESCYSTLDPTYSQFQPHIPKHSTHRMMMNTHAYNTNRT